MTMAVKLGTQSIGAAGELLVQYQLLKQGIDSARLTTDSGIDRVMYVPGHQSAATIQQTDILNCAARRFRQAYRPIPWRFTAHTDGMMSHRTAAVAAALIPLIPLIAAPEATAAGPVVTYGVHSVGGSLSTISYYDATHKLQTIMNVSSPWVLTFTSQDTYPFYSVSAQTTGTEVACQITVNDQVVSQAGREGPHSLAGCSWAAPS